MARLVLSALLLVSLHSLAQEDTVKIGRNTLAQLQEKDSIVIKDHIVGCFANITEKIVIIKQKGKLIARYYSNKNGKMKMLKKPEKTTILTRENVEDFIRFENELNYLQESNNCTTTETYTFSSKYWNVKKVDGSCEWWGLDHLRKKLFKEN